MTGTLTMIDDVLPREHFIAFRDVARRLDYKPFEYDGLEYPNVAFIPEGWTLAPVIAEALGVQTITPKLEFLRLGVVGDGAGVIHCDNAGAKWAAVLYLNTAVELKTAPTGTAFWSHVWLGRDQLPPDPEPEVRQLLRMDGRDPTPWEPLYQKLFRCRWPLEPPAARLIYVCYFDF